jgi:hypothetical protein
VEWDQPDAFEPPADVKTTEQPPATTRKSKTQPAKRTEKPTQAEESETKWKKPRQSSPVEMSQSSDDESGDEYVDNETVAAAGTKRQRRVRQRPTLPQSTHSGSPHGHPPQLTLGASSRRVIAMSSDSGRRRGFQRGGAERCADAARVPPPRFRLPCPCRRSRAEPSSASNRSALRARAQARGSASAPSHSLRRCLRRTTLRASIVWASSSRCSQVYSCGIRMFGKKAKGRRRSRIWRGWLSVRLRS